MKHPLSLVSDFRERTIAPTRQRGRLRRFRARRELGCESLEPRRLLTCATGDVCVDFEFVQAAAPNAPLASLRVGDEFLLRVNIQDNRGADAFGVFQAYFDVSYNSALATTTGSITPGPQYDVRSLGDTSTAGLLNAAGGTSDGIPSPAGDSYLLFSVPFRALAVGTLAFSAQPDNNPANRVEFIDAIGAVSNIAYSGTSIGIQGASISVTPGSGLVTSESGGTATFQVALSQQPTANVTMGLTSSDTSEGTVSPGSLTFTPANWNTPQTVTVTGVNDSVNDGDVSYTIFTSAATSSDPAYNELNVADVSVTNRDNDTAGIQVTPTTELVTTEAGGTGTFQIVLSSQPTADVMINLSSSDPSEGTLSQGTVTFTTVNWNLPRTITVTGVDDGLDDGDVAYTIVTSAATSSDPAYNGLNAADVSVTNRDNDTVGIQVTPTTGLVTTEAGGTGTFQIVLSSQPTADVVINLSSNDPSEGTLSQGTVTFTTANWNLPRTITVTGVDDGLDDGDVAYTIVTSAATSSDPAYNGLNAADVSVTNRDNDTAGIQVTPTAGLNTTESGGTATFTIVLNTQPTANVTIGLASSDASEGTISPNSVTFTSADWNTPRTVTITGVDDGLDDGDVAYTIVTSVANSSDPAYNGLNAADVLVTNRDNDAANILVSPTSGLVTTEAGGTATFSIVLGSQPTANVTIGLSSGNPQEGTVSPSSVTFTPANWNVPQPVTVLGVDDEVDDGDVAYSVITAAATSSDPSYQNVNPADVSLTNRNDDTAGVVVTPTSGLLTTETGGTAVFSMVLSSRPLTDVTINLSSSDMEEGLPSVTSLTFRPATWNVPQMVTVTGQNDDVDDGDVGYLMVTAVSASSDARYVGVNVADVSLQNQDDDMAGVVVTPTAGLSTSETGGAASFTVVLTSEPTADVVISLSSSDASEATVAPSSVTFTPANWRSPQQVTVTGVDDTDQDGNIAYTIVTSAASSSDPLYNGLNVPDVDLLNVDNDVPGISVTATSPLFTREDGTVVTFSVVLNTRPTADVTIQLSSSDTSEATLSAAALVFTPSNWQTPQTITVTGQNDNIDDGDASFEIRIEPAVSSDADYSGLDIADLPGMNLDDDTAGIQVTPVTGLETSEAGGTATFQIVLTSEPTGDVIIDLNSSDASEGVLSTASVSFTSATWNQPQLVTVSGANDPVVDGDRAYQIETAPARSADPNYQGRDADDPQVRNRDDDTATLVVAAVNPTITEGTGGSVTEFSVTVVLQGAVEGGFTAGYATDDLTAVAADGDYTDNDGTLDFVGMDGESHAVTVRVTQDSIVEPDEMFRLALGALSNIDPTAAARIAVNGSPVTATIIDDDTTTLTLAGVQANEGTGDTTTSFTFNVTLSNPVQGGFRLAYETNDGTARLADGDYLDNDGQLNFVGTAGENRPITVAVNADKRVERQESFTLLLGELTGLLSPDLAEAIMLISREATGVIVNDDTASVSFLESSTIASEPTGQHAVDVLLSVSNGGTLSEDVEVMINDLLTGTARSPADYSLGATSVRFAAGSRDGDRRSVPLSLVKDGSMEADETINLSLNVAGDGIGGGVTNDVSAGHRITLTDDPRTASLSGFVWLDVNKNGRFDPNETGIGGVNIQLTGVDRFGQGVELTASTASNGSYTFNNLFAGTYSLTETQPDDYTDGAELQGTVDGVANGIVGADQFTQITIGPAQSGRDFGFGEQRPTPPTMRQYLASSFRRLPDNATTGTPVATQSFSGRRFLASMFAGGSAASAAPSRAFAVTGNNEPNPGVAATSRNPVAPAAGTLSPAIALTGQTVSGVQIQSALVTSKSAALPPSAGQGVGSPSVRSPLTGPVDPRAVDTAMTDTAGAARGQAGSLSFASFAARGRTETTFRSYTPVAAQAAPQPPAASLRDASASWRRTASSHVNGTPVLTGQAAPRASAGIVEHIFSGDVVYSRSAMSLLGLFRAQAGQLLTAIRRR